MLRRPAFTLVELLVIVAIMGLMVTVGVVSVRSGQGAARVKGATRDIFAAIRSARSTALVTQQPAIITYSVEDEDGEPLATVRITSARLMSGSVDRSKIRTLTGAPLKEPQEPVDAGANDSSAKDAPQGDDKKDGDTLEEVLFAPIKTDVVKGMRLKVAIGEESLDDDYGSVHKSRVSVFSNVDYLLGKFREATSPGEKEKAGSDSPQAKASEELPAAEKSQEPVSVVWEANGRVQPHRVWVYADGSRPEDGLSIRIDSFGAAKVVSGDGAGE